MLTWKEAASIDWNVILLFAGGISLGNALFDTGLAKELGLGLARLTGAHTLWGITALGIAMGILLSDFTINLAATTSLVPVVISLAQGVGVSPIAPALGTALGVSLGFALPFSTASNALVYSTSLVPQRRMLWTGLVISIVGFFVVFFCLRTILPLLGLVD